MSPIVNTVHFHQLHIMKTGRIALFLAAGFARVAIKELLLSGVPHRRAVATIFEVGRYMDCESN